MAFTSTLRFSMCIIPQRRRSGRLWCRARSRSGSGGFGAEPGHVQQGSGEGSGEGLGGFGAEPGQVQQGSREAHARFRKSALKFHPDKNKERTWV